MKRISFAGISIITGSAVATALLDYATRLGPASNNVSVDVPVLEANGKISMHTILLGAGSQFDVADVDGISSQREAETFPVPELPAVGEIAISEASAATDEEAAKFNDAVAFIDGDVDDM